MPSSPTTDSFIEDEINLRDYWRILVRRRALVLGCIAVAAVATAIFTLLQPNIYQSKATLMPLGKSSGGLPAALGELGGLLPLGMGAVAKESPAERILAILHSRTLAEDVVQRLDLLPHLFPKKWDAAKQQWQSANSPTLQDAVRALGGLVSITSDKKTGVITIAVEYTDPVLAATIVNQYIDALQHILNENAFSLAKKNRLFIEAQVQKTRQDLTAAEEALRQFEQAHKIIALDTQAETAVRAIAMLQGEVMAKEVQLGVLQRTVTGASREVTLLQEELQGLRAQLAKLQHGMPEPRAAAGQGTQNHQAFLALDEAPEIKLHYVRLQREATIQSKLFSLLMQQLEQAKIEEARDETAFQVLDRAIPPDQRVKPKRRQSVIFATVFGAFLGVCAAFIREYTDPTIRTKEQVERRIGIPLLGTISPAGLSRRRRPRRTPDPEAVLVQGQASDASVVEAFRYLHTRLRSYRNERGLHTVLFTSAEPDVSSVVTLVNLAIVAANAGEKTLLVDGNLRRPALHRLLHCPLAPGLADILAEPENWHKAIQSTMVSNLFLLPAGTVTTATFALLESSTTGALLASLKGSYHFILCAAPPVLSFSDAAVLGGKVDATCLELVSGVSRIEAAVEAKSLLEAVTANVIGGVLTNVAG